MKERGVLFNAPMVRALLDGSKTQTRRLIKLPHMNPLGKWEPSTFGGPNGGRTRTGETVPLQGSIWHTRTGDCIGSPHGQPGDRLWVRETFWSDRTTKAFKWYVSDVFTPDRERDHCKLTPGIHMPRTVSRITLEITSTRAERLQDISEADALAEGVLSWRASWDTKTAATMFLQGTRARIACGDESGTAKRLYMLLWESINGPGSWDANPWVWVIEFKRV